LREKMQAGFGGRDFPVGEGKRMSGGKIVSWGDGRCGVERRGFFGRGRKRVVVLD